MTTPGSSARVLLDLLRRRTPTLGDGRLLCVDGPAGSGKSTLAAAVAEVEPGVVVVHMDDLYDGWTGLPHLGDQLAGLLAPLAEGRVGHYRRYDWLAERYAETVAVTPTDLLVLEGVGSGSADPALVTALAWVEAPEDLRLRRGLDRDGAAAEPQWRAWLPGEAAHFEAYRTRERADVLVDGTGVRSPSARGSDWH